MYRVVPRALVVWSLTAPFARGPDYVITSLNINLEIRRRCEYYNGPDESRPGPARSICKLTRQLCHYSNCLSPPPRQLWCAGTSAVAREFWWIVWFRSVVCGSAASYLFCRAVPRSVGRVCVIMFHAGFGMIVAVLCASFRLAAFGCAKCELSFEAMGGHVLVRLEELVERGIFFDAAG